MEIAVTDRSTWPGEVPEPVPCQADTVRAMKDGPEGATLPRTRFTEGPLPPVYFALAFAVWALLSNGLASWLLGAERSYLVDQLWNVPSGMGQLAIAYAFLRHAGVRLRDIGAGPRQFLPAVVAVVAVVMALNVTVGVLLLAAGEPLSFGWFALYRAPPLELATSAVAVGAVAQYLFVGPVEELAFRGYLQNKFAALLERGRSRAATPLAVVGAALVFAFLHVPTLLLLGGGSLGGLPLLTASGILFGTIYALTGNLVLVALLHGIGNLWPLGVDPGALGWPNWIVVLVVYTALVVGYRRWAARRRG